MVNQDTIGDLISRLKNSTMVRKREVSVPYSRFKREILEILKKEGFIKDVSENLRKGESFKSLDIELSKEDEKPKIEGVKRFSKPSCRKYKGYGDIFPEKTRTTIFSTPEGVMTAKEAKAKKIGGEELFKIW